MNMSLATTNRMFSHTPVRVIYPDDIGADELLFF